MFDSLKRYSKGKEILGKEWVQIIGIKYVFFYHKVAAIYTQNWYFITHAVQRTLLDLRNCLKIIRIIFSIFMAKLAQSLLMYATQFQTQF